MSSIRHDHSIFNPQSKPRPRAGVRGLRRSAISQAHSMTYKKLAVWTTIFSVIGSAIGLSMNTRLGFFSNDCGFMFFSVQGALGFVVASDGCFPNGIVAHTQPIASHSGLLSWPLLSLSSTQFSFELPGIVMLLAFSLVCIFLFRRARRDRSDNVTILAEQAASRNGA